MSVSDTRTVFRDQLSTLVSNLEDFDENLPDTQEKLGEFVEAVVAEVQTNPLSDLGQLLAPELDSTRFDRVHSMIYNKFLRRDVWRTDKLVANIGTRLVTIDTQTGNLIDILDTIPDTNFAARGNRRNLCSYQNNVLSFIGRTVDDSNEYFITQVDIDTMEVMNRIPLDSTNIADNSCFLQHGDRFYFTPSARVIRCVDLDGNILHETDQLGSSGTLVHLTPIDANTLLCGRSPNAAKVTFTLDLDQLHSQNGGSGASRTNTTADPGPNNRIITSSGSSSGTASLNNTRLVDYTNADGFTLVNTLTPTPRGVLFGLDNYIYRTRGGSLIERLDSELEEALETVSVSDSPTTLYWSDDDYIFVQSNSRIAKIDPLDFTVIWDVSVEDLELSGSVNTIAPLRPQGGIHYLNFI